MMTKPTKRKLPEWLQNTFQIVGSLTVLMVLYNWIGPMIKPHGTYFPWWTLPISVVLALIMVGLWSYFEFKQKNKERQRKLKQQQSRQQAAIQQAQVEKEAVQQAAKRRARNLNHQQR